MELPLALANDTKRWTVGVDGASMWVEWGKAGGKMQRSERRYGEGKQGRTAEQQAEFEAVAAARKKMRLGYEPAGPGAPEPGAAGAPLPMLATDWGKLKRPERLLAECLLQPKLDGIRCVVSTATGAMFSRTGKPLVSMPHIEEAVRLASQAAAPPAAWLDGEVYRHGASFQGIVGAARRTVNVEPGGSAALQLHLFDTVDEAPAAERSRRLHGWLAAASGLVSPGRLEPLQAVHTEALRAPPSLEALRGTVDAAVARFIGQGYEGAILRVAAAPYCRAKRSLDLVKAKRFLQEEFEVVEIEERDRQPGTAGAVRCRTVGGLEFSATPECTEADKVDMWRRRDEYLGAQWLATVRYQELTDAGVPRFPVCAGMRHQDDS
jgi:DNA ligase-1